MLSTMLVALLVWFSPVWKGENGCPSGDSQDERRMIGMHKAEDDKTTTTTTIIIIIIISVKVILSLPNPSHGKPPWPFRVLLLLQLQ